MPTQNKAFQALKTLARRNLPFRKALGTVKINCMAEDDITTRGNQVVQTNINMVNYKVHFTIIAEGKFNMEVQEHRVNTSLENLKEVPFTNNSNLVPLASMTLIHRVVRKLFTKEISNVPLAGRLSQSVKQWEKITHDQSLLVDEEISELLEKGAKQKQLKRSF